ncbi:MAG: PIN domain-containing protein [Deltaproteobacteria bacterium]|nr:PIN domain-containing protein [Deltaproteobacteria bacterium]
MNVEKSFIDTNIIVYAFDQSDKQRNLVAADLLRILVNTNNAVISVQVLKEFFITVTRKIKVVISEQEATQIINDLCIMHVVDDILPLLHRALALKQNYSLSLWDATIIAAAIATNCHYLYTEDLQAGQNIEGLIICNPFIATG